LELLVLAVALALSAALGLATFHALAGAFLVAWAAVELLARTRLGPGLTRVAREQGALVALASIVPALALGARLGVVAEGEGLAELGPRLADRLRLEGVPTLAPPLVAADRPQSFFVRAEGAREVEVRFGEGAPAIAATRLGHGVFRVELDPRRDPLGEAGEDGLLEVSIAADGSARRERVPVSRPLAHPRRARASADGRAICVTSEETDEVGIGGPRGLARSSSSDGPVGCAFSGDRVLVAARHAEALEVRGASGTLAQGPVVGRGATAIAGSAGRVVVARDGEVRELVVLDAGLAITGRLALEGVPLAVELVSDGLAAVTTRSPAALLLVALEGAPRVVGERSLAMPASAIAVAPGGDALVLATTAFSEDGAPGLGNHLVEDQLVWLRVPSLSWLRALPTARRTERQDHAGDVDRGLSPVSLAFDAEGALLVAFAGSHELARFPLEGPAAYVDLAPLAFVPAAAIATSDGFAVTSPTSGALLWLDRDLAPRALERWAPADDELLRGDPASLRLRYGERTFWEATRAGASCQSCHTEGSTDGEPHNIGGRVLAPTLDVRGLAGTAPFLRDGSYPRLGDLHEVAVLEYRGYREPAGDRRATLDAWLASLPLPTSQAPRDLARERRGLDAFFEAGCARCHAPPAFTSLARYAARTVFPDARLPDPATSFDVPALRNLRGNEPYLFDGRAETLRDVLTTENREHQHGDVRALLPADLDELVFFLETL
jgi:mono/diheme cytochrome c family protein